MKTVNIEATAEVKVPLRLKLELTVKADDDKQQFGHAVRQFAKGFCHVSGADLEEVTVVDHNLDEVIQEVVEKGYKVVDWKVVESH